MKKILFMIILSTIVNLSFTLFHKDFIYKINSSCYNSSSKMILSDEVNFDGTSSFYKVYISHDIQKYIEYTGDEYQHKDDSNSFLEEKMYYHYYKEKIRQEIDKHISNAVKRWGDFLDEVDSASYNNVYFYFDYTQMIYDIDTLFAFTDLPYINSVKIEIISLRSQRYAEDEPVKPID